MLFICGMCVYVYLRTKILDFCYVAVLRLAPVEAIAARRLGAGVLALVEADVDLVRHIGC